MTIQAGNLQPISNTRQGKFHSINLQQHFLDNSWDQLSVVFDSVNNECILFLCSFLPASRFFLLWVWNSTQVPGFQYTKHCSSTHSCFFADAVHTYATFSVSNDGASLHDVDTRSRLSTDVLFVNRMYHFLTLKVDNSNLGMINSRSNRQCTSNYPCTSRVAGATEFCTCSPRSCWCNRVLHVQS